MTRLEDISTFYTHLRGLERRIGGTRTLAECDGRMGWPERGVYFFFEQGENRSRSGAGFRVVRVGTHALKAQSRASLWRRLSQHRGTQRSLGGNHRGSIFRLMIGEALVRNGQIASVDSWGHGSTASQSVRETERPIEVLVSRYIGTMPFLFLPISDAPGSQSLRGYIERNSISLLSGCIANPIDLPSNGWLGLSSGRERVRRSGLWNNHHTDGDYSLEFMNIFAQFVAETERFTLA